MNKKNYLEAEAKQQWEKRGREKESEICWTENDVYKE